MMYAGDEFYGDDVTSGIARCVACDIPIGEHEHSDTVCDDCSGLARCVDDICHGQGYCMHKKDAWRP